MKDFRLLAAKIDQHMQQLSAQGINDAHAIKCSATPTVRIVGGRTSLEEGYDRIAAWRICFGA